MLGWTPSVQSSPHIYVWKMGVGTRVCMRVYLWIGKISWRFHKHTILQISLKIWARRLRVIPKNGETKSGPNRANSQRNTNIHSLHKIRRDLESWFQFFPCGLLRKTNQYGFFLLKVNAFDPYIQMKCVESGSTLLISLKCSQNEIQDLEFMSGRNYLAE